MCFMISEIREKIMGRKLRIVDEDSTNFKFDDDIFVINFTDNEVKAGKVFNLPAYLDVEFDNIRTMIIEDNFTDLQVLKNGELVTLTAEEIENLFTETTENEDDTIVEFKAVKEDDCISGYMFVSESDDEQPLHFYDENGLEIGTHLPYSESELYTAFCEDFMLIQYLVAFAEENKTIDRGDYTLIINEGEPQSESIEVTIKNAEAVLEATVRPHGNGARVMIPKKYIGRKVKIVILTDD